VLRINTQTQSNTDMTYRENKRSRKIMHNHLIICNCTENGGHSAVRYKGGTQPLEVHHHIKIIFDRFDGYSWRDRHTSPRKEIFKSICAFFMSTTKYGKYLYLNKYVYVYIDLNTETYIYIYV
jgi:hypothetical protein